jgi:hypothetical protein
VLASFIHAAIIRSKCPARVVKFRHHAFHRVRTTQQSGKKTATFLSQKNFCHYYPPTQKV